MKNIILILLFLTACNQPYSVKIPDLDFKPKSKTVTITGDQKYVADLRSALQDAGYTVLKKDMVKQVSVSFKNENGRVSEKYSSYSSRYIIDIVKVRKINYCLTDPSIDYVNMDLEIFDMETNEVVMFIKSGGRTGSCFGSLISPNIFTGEIVPALNKLWKNMEKSEEGKIKYRNFEQ